METNKKYKAIDFFCGGGGMTCGLRQAGIEVIAGVDFDKDAKETYEYNDEEYLLYTEENYLDDSSSDWEGYRGPGEYRIHFYETRKRSKKSKPVENYLKMLTDLGYYYKYPKKKMKVIKDKLMALDKSDFLELFRSDKAISAVLNYYPVVTGQINLKNRRGKNDVGINPKDIEEDVFSLYDNIYDNLDDILSDYA
mgnify:CR=1 FL=1